MFSFFSLLSLPEIIFSRHFSFLLDSPVGLPVPYDFGSDPSDGLLKIRLFQLTLPNDDNAPAFRLKLTPDLLITFLIPRDFSYPEFGVGIGDHIILTAFVTMPKTAMHENDGPILGKDDIRPPREALVVYPIPEPLTPECVTQTKLRTSILGSVMRHALESLLGRHFCK